MAGKLAKKSQVLGNKERVVTPQKDADIGNTSKLLPGQAEFRELVGDVERNTRTSATADFLFIRDAFQLDPADRLVTAFQDAYTSTAGQALPLGPKPFVDDGNSFWSLRQIPAITHGARAGGQHTVNEWVSIDDLMRVAHVYALTAIAYC